MKKMNHFNPASKLKAVKYEIRGVLDQRAQELEKQGNEIIKLNIGNPAAFGFRAPETMMKAVIENLHECSGYSLSKGIFPAREAVVMDSQAKGIRGVTSDEVFLGNGVSELIMMCMEALLEPGDEVLIPSPDYPLWTAAVVINGGVPKHYPCVPTLEPEKISEMITPKTRAIVIINPNNPTGAVYSKELLQEIIRVAEENHLIVFSDEIYDRILYDGAQHTPTASLCHQTLCITFNGLSKVYRAAGLRTGWAFLSGDKSEAGPFLKALELLSSLRLCPGVPGQHAVQTALGGIQSIYDLTAPTGRLGKQRQSLLQAVEQSKFLSHTAPKGALYSFIKVNPELLPGFNDREFAMRLLEEKHVLVVPGSSFNWPTAHYFRVTFLPDASVLEEVFERIDSLLSAMTKTSKDRKTVA
jgi:alanine-synthesizing transaminase